MREEIKLEQGTEEWLEFRRHHRMASETAAIMGLSDYSSPADVRNAKRGKSIADNAPMRQGREQEPIARAAYESEYEPMRPAIYVHGDYGCSLDGINIDEDVILEIKTPFKNAQQSPRWKAAIDGYLLPPDEVQVQHQLMVSGAKLAHFWVWDAVKQEGILVPVLPNPHHWEKIKAAWDEFWPSLAERDDKPWQLAAQQYIEAKKRADETSAALAEAKANMVSLATGDYSHGAGVEVKQVSRIGTIDWQSVQRQLLPDANLEPFRKKGTEYFEVRVQT